MTSSRPVRAAGVIGLAIAMLAAGRLLTLPEPRSGPPPAAVTAETSVQDVWPAATVVRSPGRLSDGRAYTPWHHLNASVSVGTALAGDGSAMRLLVRDTGAGGSERELLRLPATGNPQFNGFATDGDNLVFMASAEDAAGTTGNAGNAGTTMLYRARWSDGAASVLTRDPGQVVFFNSQYDVVVTEGRAHWAVAGEGGRYTEIRSVPLAGGRVTGQRIDGAYALSAWPWLTSAGSQDGSVEMRHLTSGERLAVGAGPNELVTCGPVWCRVMILGASGQAARTDVMRPTGADRKRIASGGVTSAVLDVALIDRFEVLSQPAAVDGPAALKLSLYDVPADRRMALASGVATVQARDAVVWWSTGEEEAAEWFALDLRTLT